MFGNGHVIFRVICHENQSRHRQPQDQLITKNLVTNENITQRSSFLALVNLPSFPHITYNFLCVQGPISQFRVVFWTPKIDIKQIKK